MAMKFPIRIAFVEALGFELLRQENGEAEIGLAAREDQLNAWGVVHGGVTMTLLDTVMAHAARSPVAGTEPDHRGVVTIEMKTSFMRPGEGRLVATGKVLHKTNSFAFCEGSVFDAGHALVAHATGTFKYLKALPSGGRKLKRQDASD